MDPLDTLLIQAWNRVSKKVREDRVLAFKRSRRRFTGIGTRPMREWCLVIRASDTRINPHNAVIEIDPDVTLPARVEDPAKHTVLIDGRLIREMTKPVTIEWPGVTYEEAAAICGREYRSFKSWVRKCPFRIDHYREHRFPRLKGEAPNVSRGRESVRGGRPRVWTPSPIDPNNSTGRPPHAVWGTLWQSQWKKLPEDYQLIVQRVPVFKKEGRRKGRGSNEKTFRGWNWVCPGRMRTEWSVDSGQWSEREKRSEVRDQRSELQIGAKPWGGNGAARIDAPPTPLFRGPAPSEGGGKNETHPLWSALQAQHSGGGEYVPCGRRCKYLYGPQTVWTLPMAMAGGSLDEPEDGFDMPDDSGLAGQWFPGMSDTVAPGGAGTRVFACKRCWAVRSACMANETGWNEFISTITGGLLYGHEVERPLDVCPIVRKWPVYQRPPRKKARARAFTTEHTENTERELVGHRARPRISSA